MYESRTSSAASFERGEGEGDDPQLHPIVASAARRAPPSHAPEGEGKRDDYEQTTEHTQRAVCQSVSSHNETEALDCPRTAGRQESGHQERVEDLHFASASCTTAFAAALSGI